MSSNITIQRSHTLQLIHCHESLIEQKKKEALPAKDAFEALRKAQEDSSNNRLASMNISSSSLSDASEDDFNGTSMSIEGSSLSVSKDEKTGYIRMEEDGDERDTGSEVPERRHFAGFRHAAASARDTVRIHNTAQAVAFLNNLAADDLDEDRLLSKTTRHALRTLIKKTLPAREERAQMLNSLRDVRDTKHAGHRSQAVEILFQNVLIPLSNGDISQKPGLEILESEKANPLADNRILRSLQERRLARQSDRNTAAMELFNRLDDTVIHAFSEVSRGKEAAKEQQEFSGLIKQLQKMTGEHAYCSNEALDIYQTLTNKLVKGFQLQTSINSIAQARTYPAANRGFDLEAVIQTLMVQLDSKGLKDEKSAMEEILKDVRGF